MEKIGFFMHNFNGGGAERVTILLANQLIKSGYQVSMIVRENKGILEKMLDPKVEILKLGLEKENKLSKNTKNIKILKDILNKEEYDCLFSVSAPMSLIAAISKSLSKSKTKLFCVIHNAISMESKSFKKVRYILMRYFDKFVTKTIVVSEDARLDYIQTVKVPESKTVTIYNPVITENFEKRAKETIGEEWLQEDRTFKTIINIGRLTSQKNQELLLKAIKTVSKDEDVRLLILGEGELKEELEKSIKEKKLEKIVKLKGFVEKPEAYLSRADLFVLSSNYEGLPTVLIEALAVGCKIVSTNCKTGPREILEDGEYGKLVPIDNAQEMAKAIIKQLDITVDKQKLIQRGMQFSTENALKKYIELIEENNKIVGEK